ncbi:hypothetical protein ABXS75_01680 [Roseburia hominis]
MEFILELAFEGSIEISKSRKVPKYIKYPLIVVIILFFVSVIGIIFFTGIISLKDHLLLGILLILFGIFMLIMSIIKFKKTYLTRIDN